MAVIYVDNKPYEVAEGQNLLQACLSLGFDIPYFCWHPALHSVGACRQCAVKQFRDANDTRGRIVMSCMTPASDGARISIDDPEVKAFRAAVIEWLMVNHPHDCPVCDEGGECHLQDMTYLTGHNYRRFRFKKRTFRNQYLGPFVKHEMNRCIQCYRCVRFYRDYAGGRDLDVFGVHDRLYFGRVEDGVLENEFSGNLVEICPTGVFTDATLARHYTRKWDLQSAPSICVHCGLGCNTIPGERYGTLRRIVNRYNGAVNRYFLCDRGRFGYEFVNSDRRLRRVVDRRSAGLNETAGAAAEADEVLAQVARLLSPGTRVIGIGSPRASLEANYALRCLVGPGQFYLGLGETEQRLAALVLSILQRGPAPTPPPGEVEQHDAVLVLGEDVTNVAPRLALSLRQAVRQQPLKKTAKLGIARWDDGAVRRAMQDERGPLFIATVAATRLDDVATQTYRAAPSDIARLGFAVAKALNAGLNLAAAQPEEGEPLADLPADVQELARRIAEAMREAERPLVIAGISLGDETIVQAAADVAWALRAAGRPAGLLYALPEPNTMGLAMLGGGSFAQARQVAREGRVDAVLILENDLYRRAPAADVEEFLAAAGHVIAIDHLANPTTEKAEVVLPAATFAESDGTFISSEGRAQRFFQVFVPSLAVKESWRWLRDLSALGGRADLGSWQTLDELLAHMADELPALRGVLAAAPGAEFRRFGMKIARQTLRWSGRTAVAANVDVSEPKPPYDPDSPLAFSMEGYQDQPPPSLIPRLWAPGWNSWQQATPKFQAEVDGPLRGGNPGRRLLEPASDGEVGYFRAVPPAFRMREGEWLLVPLYHIFGSEELSAAAPAIAERSPGPYLALNEGDARRLGVAAGQEVALLLGGEQQRLPVVLNLSLPAGVAGLPAGLPGLAGIELPAWAALEVV